MPAQHGVRYGLSLCKYIQPHLEHKSMALWPPSSIPSLHRVRNESPTKFSSDEQRPSSLAVSSDRTFRLRRWIEMSNIAQTVSPRRVGEKVLTWSTLLQDTYTPSKQKPWQGIWIGDYSSHGCELLLVIQRSGLPLRKRKLVSATDSGLPAGFLFEDDLQTEEGDASSQSPQRKNQIGISDEHAAVDIPQSTSLEAIKLTGDPNVPRGQPTWFAEDIGDSGLIRMAEDDTFRGARIVRSVGHVANRGFKDDRYIPSELILKDFENIAQHWEVGSCPVSSET